MQISTYLKVREGKLRNWLVFGAFAGLFLCSIAVIEVDDNTLKPHEEMYSKTLTKYANKNVINSVFWDVMAAKGITSIACGTEDSGAAFCQPNNNYARIPYPLYIEGEKDQTGTADLFITTIDDKIDNQKIHAMKIYFNSKGNNFSITVVEKALDTIIGKAFSNIDNHGKF